jgi:hypothetical protein
MVCRASARFQDTNDFVAEMYVDSNPACTVDAAGVGLVFEGSNKYFDVRGLCVEVSADPNFLRFDGNLDAPLELVKVAVDAASYDGGAGTGKGEVRLTPDTERGDVDVAVKWELTNLRFQPKGIAPLPGGAIRLTVI